MQTANEKDPNGHKVSIKGNEIYYKKVGNGDHVVLLMTDDLGTTNDFTQQLEGIDNEKFTLIAWDPPGYGLSGPSERDFNDFFRKDTETAAQLMKVLGYDKYSIMGWGAGGVSGVILSAKYPDNVNRLVIWGTKPYYTEADREYDTDSKSDFSILEPKTRQKYLNVYGEESFKKLWTKYVDSIVQYEDFCKEDAKLVKCQTFLLHGDFDIHVCNEQYEYFMRWIRNIRKYRFREGRHDIHVEYADEFNKLVQEFLLKDQELLKHDKERKLYNDYSSDDD